MLAAGYSEYQAHKSAHDRLMEEIGSARRELAKGTIEPCQALDVFVQSWLHHHLDGCDRQLMAFIAGTGDQKPAV